MFTFDEGDTVMPLSDEDTGGGVEDRHPTFVTKRVQYGYDDWNDKAGLVEYQTERYENRMGGANIISCRMVLCEKIKERLYNG